MIYAEGMETTLREENSRLAKELSDAQLDLDDARRSRRDLQQQLNLAQQQIGKYTSDFDNMRVGSSCIAEVAGCSLTSAESKPLYYGID